MNSKIISKLFLVIPLALLSQGKKTFYEDGVLKGDSIYDINKNLSLIRYYHKNGNLQLEAFYDIDGALTDYYALDEKGDTTLKSQIPLLKKQPFKDLSFIEWRKTDYHGLSYAKEKTTNLLF